MVLIEDSRQKPDKNKHIKEQLEQLGHTVIRSKMLVGDYQIANKGDTVVDTKYGMGEIENNLVHDHERFRNECILAQEAGIKLIVLIQDEKITQMGEVFSWYNIRRKWSKNAVTGRTLGKIMYSMKEKYGVDFVFCKRSDIGHRIVELLEVQNEKEVSH